MRMLRRRFLMISAAMAMAPQGASAVTWQGQAMGADVSLTIRGAEDLAAVAVAEIRTILDEVEGLFSLYDPASQLAALNATGRLRMPDHRFLALLDLSDRANAMTDGLFDPTVQPLWHAIAQGGDVAAARARVGWRHVRWDADEVRLGPSQALTLNGIAQGFATDLVTERLKALGLTQTLVNIGEYRAIGGPWRLALTDPVHGTLGMRSLTDTAIATSSPPALRLGDDTHILHPVARPLWSTVSVEASSAALADGLSTGLCLAPRAMAEALRHAPGVQRITLVDFEGNLTSF